MHRRTPFKPMVLLSKAVFLQRIQEAVGQGYRYYASGTVTAHKALPLARKFAELYGIALDKNARYRRRARGLGNARLLMRLNESLGIDFFLLVTAGDHAAHHLERLRDATKAPIHYREFELVALTLKGRGKPGLTWRLDAQTVEAWQQRLQLHTAHYDRLELFRAWHSLYRVPGFAGVRRQVGLLVAYWRREWRKLRGDDPCPVCYPHSEPQFRHIPGIRRGEDGMYWPERGFPTMRQLPTLFYVRKRRDIGEPLHRLVRSLAEHDSASTTRPQ